MDHKLQIPVYEKIAIDLAHRIYEGSLKIGDKIYGRSVLAGEYHVSPETIRRAMKILEDVGIVQSTKGSGTLVVSKEQAYFYINRFIHLESVRDLERNVYTLLNKREELDQQMVDNMKKILEYSHRLKSTNPLTPVEVEIPGQSIYLGNSISESKFWQNTGGTIVAVKRDGKLIISPGPYTLFLQGDILLVVGDEHIGERVFDFLNQESNSYT